MKLLSHLRPHKEWKEGLPIGNGRLAAMIWGDEGKDTLTLNHEWLWRGENRNRKPTESAKYLGEVRKLFKQGRFFRGTMFANLYFGGEGGFSAEKNRVDPYQVAGELHFEFRDGRFESSSLDIEHGVACTVYKAGDVRIMGTFTASCITNLLTAEWSADTGRFSGILKLDRVNDPGAFCHLTVEPSGLTYDCEFIGGISFRIVTAVCTDGKATATEEGLKIENAGYVKVLANIATSVFDLEAEIARYPLCFGDMSANFESHKRLWAENMNKVKLELEAENISDEMPTEQRLSLLRQGKDDNGLVTLYFNYGRYLMLASTICGDLPPNLQGKWNNMIDPPWESDYHCDINLEMSHWLTEPCNMPECADKLLHFLESFYESGHEAAQALYGCRGIYLPIQTDAWGKSTPESFGWAVWIGAAPWFAQHFWHHYIYSGDLEFLRNRGYRFFKAVARFYEDYLEEDGQGILQIIPSQSPENKFKGCERLPVSLCVSAAMDVQLAYDALGYAFRAAEILGIDADDAKKWKDMQARLPDFKVGADGRLLEWNEEKQECEDELGHRHLSHLYGVYPSELFTARSYAEQFKAAKKSFDFRMKHGGGHTGWSRAWVSCLCARFGDAEGLYENFIALIRDFATVSLLDLHPPGWFQIDGNFGGVAAILEAVVSYTDQRIFLLRTLPHQWRTGRLQGIKAPGGHTLDIEWKDGIVTMLRVKIGYLGKAIFVVNGQEVHVGGTQGEWKVVLLQP